MLTSHVNRVGGLHNSYCQSPICFWPSQSPVVMLHQGTRCSKNKQDLPPVPSGSLSWPWTFHDIWWHPATPPLTRILTSPCPCQKMFILRWPLPISQSSCHPGPTDSPNTNSSLCPQMSILFYTYWDVSIHMSGCLCMYVRCVSMPARIYLPIHYFPSKDVPGSARHAPGRKFRK